MKLFRLLCLLTCLGATLPGQEKLRVIIETDAGGDPDDEQSLVRFLVYANEWDIEGIIANRPAARERENRNTVRTGLGIVRRFLDAYGEIQPRLREHAAGFPTKEYLWARTVPGYDDTDDGVNLIMAAVDRDDPRPIWFQNWGTDRGSAESSLKRALDRVRVERGAEGYAKFKSKLLLSSADKFGEHTTTLEPAWRLWVLPSLPNMDGGNWYHRFGPLTADAGGFDLERDVRTGHGPLGALYPTNTNIRQKEGDTPMFLYLIPTGMNDPLQPGYGSWAGRFGVRTEQAPSRSSYYWANLRDTRNGTTHRDHTLARWAVDLQNDFRARMDWCVKPRAEANHPPLAVLQGDRTKKILALPVRAGTEVSLSARDSIDPDGHALACEWIIYPEAGTYRGEVTLVEPHAERTRIGIPRDAAGSSVHVILIVRDQGTPRLASYRRAVLNVAPE
jgi:hypothetical protein